MNSVAEPKLCIFRLSLPVVFLISGLRYIKRAPQNNFRLHCTDKKNFLPSPYESVKQWPAKCLQIRWESTHSYCRGSVHGILSAGFPSSQNGGGGAIYRGPQLCPRILGEKSPEMRQKCQKLKRQNQIRIYFIKIITVKTIKRILNLQVKFF